MENVSKGVPKGTGVAAQWASSSNLTSSNGNLIGPNSGNKDKKRQSRAAAKRAKAFDAKGDDSPPFFRFLPRAR